MTDANAGDIEPLDRPKGITTSTDDTASGAGVVVSKTARLTEIPAQEAAVRATLAYIFSVIFGATVALGFISSMTGYGWANTRELLQLLLPAETALLGSAVGFYFGTRKSGNGG